MTAENIEEISLKDEMKSSYIDYAMSVVVGRAIPDVRDGLKPVHRRIIFAMTDNNYVYNNPHVKSARIVGECFTKGTLVCTSKGLTPIENITTADLVFTQNGLKTVLNLYELPQKHTYQIKLENGLINTCTSGQKFKVFTEDLKFIWKLPENINPGDFIVCRSAFMDHNNYRTINDIVFDENLAYFLGLFLADGWIDRDNARGYHRITIALKSIEVMNRIKNILLKKFKQNVNILKRKEDFYYIRINKSELNQKLINAFRLEDKYAYNIKVPQILFESPKEVIFSFISGYLDGDGHVHKNRNVISLVSISENFVRSIQVLLFSLGINSALSSIIPKSHNYRGKEIKGTKEAFFLEIRSNSFFKLKEHLKLSNLKKKRNLSKINKNYPSKYEEIPFLGRLIFKEFSEKHLGGGWYLNK